MKTISNQPNSCSKTCSRSFKDYDIHERSINCCWKSNLHTCNIYGCSCNCHYCAQKTWIAPGYHAPLDWASTLAYMNEMYSSNPEGHG
ncbi:hypothetical protein CDAR_597451 [Caerostris darwini]|uniref:Uncharacterized protein n=1 Tax=Caerostris darwini TaxID=1538125 RepID=A0AAV4TYJ2_9ARAC|nr:hypothetical protein CDAR_597451 [Caerostris darwini]